MREILLADDELVIRQGIHELLERSGGGYAVVAQARSGAEAASLFAKLLPDIVIMDIRMPGMTGLEAFAQMRAVQSHTQCIFISAYSDPLYLRTALRSEAVDYLFKPIDPEELRAALRRAEERLQALGVPASAERQAEGRDAAAQRIAAEVRRYIQTQYAHPLTVQRIADAVHLSPAYLCTLYKRCTGETVLQYLTEVRMQAALSLLRTTELPIYAVAQRVGYQDYRYFKQLFQRCMRMSPLDYRERERGGT